MLYLKVAYITLLVMILSYGTPYIPQTFDGSEDDFAAIVGTWEFVEITGTDDEQMSLIEIFQGMVETFYPDGTGQNIMMAYGGRALCPEYFTWVIRDNILIMYWENEGIGEMHMFFSVSDSKLITLGIYNLEHYPDSVWIFRRVE